jgi:hypothetical protein
MDHYTPERLFLDRMREVTEAAERHARLYPAPGGASAPRVWIAIRLRALADRLDDRLDDRFDEERRLIRA